MTTGDDAGRFVRVLPEAATGRVTIGFMLDGDAYLHVSLQRENAIDLMRQIDVAIGGREGE